MQSLQQQRLYHRIEGINDDVEILKCSSFCFNGTTYSRNMTVFVSCNDDLLVFGKIKELFVHNDEAYLICDLFKATHFDEHFHSYIVTSTKDVDLINVKMLYNYVPLHIRTSYILNDSSMYITLKHKPCCTNGDFGLI